MHLYAASTPTSRGSYRRFCYELNTKSLKLINRQIFIKFQQNCFKQDKKYYVLRFPNLLIWFRMTTNWQSS
jgi:hypothetical protein